MNARRRAFQILRDNEAVAILFEEIAPRFTDRVGGYTRVMRLAKPRLGDAGTRAILEFVGDNDRVKIKDTAKPSFADDDQADADEDVGAEDVTEEEAVEEASEEVSGEAEASADESAEAGDSDAEDKDE